MFLKKRISNLSLMQKNDKFAESNLDSAKSQNLAVKNNPCDSTNRISPDSWCKKSESKGAVVPPADFLLEAEKRGSPSKSEKRSFWRVEGAGRGVQPFCEKESSEISGKGGAESALDSAVDCHESANADSCNDENRDSSPTAQNDNFILNLTLFAESNLDSVESQNLIENTLRGSILEIKSGFCETSDKDKTKVYRGSELKQSPILARKTNAQ